MMFIIWTLLLLIKLVSSEPPVVTTSVPLCCEQSSPWAPNASSCVKSTEPTPMSLSQQDLMRLGFPAQQRFVVKSGFPHCHNGFFELKPDNEPGDEFTLTTSGNLIINGFTRHEKTPDLYCLLWFTPDGAEKRTFHPLVCYDEALIPQESNFIKGVKQVFYPLALGISDFFFLLTIIVFALLPEMRDIYGKCVMSNVACLFFGYFFLILLNNSVRPEHGIPCLIIGLAMYVSFMGAFFWLNVISFHVLITARMWSLGGNNPWRWYCTYAWGSTLICLLVFLGVEFGLEWDHPWRPAFRVQACWFVGDLTMTAFFYGPIAVILFVNAIMFIATAITLFRIKKEETSASHKITFKLYLKMFFIMGFTWLLELIGWRIKDDINDRWLVMLLLDLVNLFQGVFIFIIMVCKKKVFQLLKIRYLGAPSPTADMEMRHSVI